MERLAHAAADRMISADHEYADRRAALDAMLTEMSPGPLPDVLPALPSSDSLAARVRMFLALDS
jgi:hypothetical protein